MDDQQILSDRIRWLRELRAAIPKTSDQIMPRTLEIWARRLVTIPLVLLAEVAVVLVERHTFFPALAEILTACREIEDCKADRAWLKRVEGWKDEAISAGDAVKMLEAVGEKAGIALVETKSGFSGIGRKRS